MSLFDSFRSGPKLELSPAVALMAGCLYIVAADGDFSEEERAMIGGLAARDGRDTLEKALKYYKMTEVGDYLDIVGKRFRPSQKLQILLNMVDLVMADGNASNHERSVINRAQAVWEISDEDLAPHFATLVAKNDRSLLYDNG